MKLLGFLLLFLPVQGAMAIEPGEKLLVTNMGLPTWIKAYSAFTGDLIGNLDPGGQAELSRAHSVRLGPDGLLYITNIGPLCGDVCTNRQSPDELLYMATGHGGAPIGDKVTRMDPITGLYVDTFIPPGAGGIHAPTDAIHGSDGHLYVASYITHSVVRFDGVTGEYIDTFIASGVGGLYHPELMTFGPGGHLYIASREKGILQYHGETGEFMRVFISPELDVVNDPHVIIFGSDGHAYVSMFGNDTVQRFDALTGEHIDMYITWQSGGNDRPHGMAFGLDGDFYLTSYETNEVLRYKADTGEFRDVFISAGNGNLDGPAHLLFIPVPKLDLTVSAPVLDADNTIIASGAEPGEIVYFYQGQETGISTIPECTDPPGLITDAKLIGTSLANAQGQASLTQFIPSSLSSNSFLLGAVTTPSCKRSNVVRFSLP